MKIIGKIIYSIGILFIGFLVYRTSSINQLRNYYKEVALPALIDNNREEYMNSFITSESLLSYAKEPIYTALSYDDKFPFELSIYNAKKTETDEILLFYFDDRNPLDASLRIDYESLAKNKDIFKSNNKSIIIRINIFMDDHDIPTTNYFPVQMADRYPLGIINLNSKDSNNLVFEYMQKTSEQDMKPKINQAKKITKMELILEDHSNEKIGKEVISTKMAEFNSSALTDGKTEVLESVDGVLKSNNFNGDINTYDINYSEVSDSDVFVRDPKVLNKYNKRIVKPMLIYTLVVLVITYLYYFLAPTIRYFKAKKKRSQV